MDLTIFLHVIIESGFAMLCILAAVYIRMYTAADRGVRRGMMEGLIVSAVINIADALAYMFRGNVTETGAMMTRVSNFVVFAGMFVLLAVGNFMLDEVLKLKGGGKDKRLRDTVYAICAAAMIALILSRIFGFFYGFDAHNYYHRGSAYMLIPLLAFAGLALVAARVVKEKAVLNRGEFYAAMSFCLLPVIGTIVQALYYGISIANIANSIALLIILVLFVREQTARVSVKKSFILSAASIDSISEDIDSFLDGIGAERQNRIRIRFTIEDALLRIWHKFGDMELVKVTAGIKFGKPSIRIMHDGSAFNPFIRTDEGYDDWSSGLLLSAGLSPDYSYSHGRNNIKITMGRLSLNPLITVLVAIAFGLLTGLIAMIALSQPDIRFVTGEILEPVYVLWNNMLFSISAPAMFLIVTSTMLNTREVSEQGGNTGLITGRYLAAMLLAGAAPIAVAGIIKSEAFSSGAFTKYTVSGIIKSLFSVIPENLLDPFRDFNTAQLIIMGMVLAYAIMAAGRQASGLASIIQQLNMIAMQLAQWIAGFMPAFTVFLTAKLVLENNAGLLTGLLTIMPFAVIVSVLYIALTLLFVSRRTGVDPGVLLRKLMPSLRQTLKTGQVADSYALAENCCIRELGIRKVFTQRMMPVGLVLYMPVSMIGMVSFVLFAAYSSGIPITPLWLITAIIFALIMLVAAPPIPGVNLLSYVVIIEQLGIGREYVIAAMIFDIIFDLFAAATNQMMLQMDLMIQADGYGMLDRKKLWKNGDKDVTA